MYQRLEAYLNGIAYDCFRAFHGKLGLEDHDFLAEWDSKRKWRKFVAFEQKVFGYPKLCGRLLGIDIDLSEDPDAKVLVGEGKELRDSLTHQSPYPDPDEGDLAKLAQIMGISRQIVEGVLKSGVAYMLKVETALGHDPAKSTPWLQPVA